MNPAHMYHDGFVKVAVRLSDGGPVKTCWAKPIKRTPERVTFQVVGRDGDKWRTGTTGEENAKEFIICTPENVVREQPAVLDLNYTELEVVKPGEFEAWRAARMDAAGPVGSPSRLLAMAGESTPPGFVEAMRAAVDAFAGEEESELPTEPQRRPAPVELTRECRAKVDRPTSFQLGILRTMAGETQAPSASAHAVGSTLVWIGGSGLASRSVRARTLETMVGLGYLDLKPGERDRVWVITEAGRTWLR